MTSLDEFLDDPKFATAINCIDGRTQLPVINYIKKKYQVDFVDLITEPGADLVMATRNPDKLPSIKERVKLSLKVRSSELVFLVAHGDCAGNPASENEHLGHLRRGMECLRGWELDADIVGLYVTDKDWSVDEFAVITRA